LYAWKTVNRRVSLLYSGTLFVLGFFWFLTLIVPFPIIPFFTFIPFFSWLIFGQTFLNLLLHLRRTPATPRPETDAQTDQHPLPKHYKKTFSKDARVHFLGVWFVTTSKTSVQAFHPNNFV
jgi:hypothetical protein